MWDNVDKKAKGRKTSVIKRKKFEGHKNCLEVAQIKNKINHLEKDQVNIHSYKLVDRVHKK